MSKRDEFCCGPARRSMFFRHAKRCRVWKYRDVRDLKGQTDDIGQGEGCEGSKCAVKK